MWWRDDKSSNDDKEDNDDSGTSASTNGVETCGGAGGSCFRACKISPRVRCGVVPESWL